MFILLRCGNFCSRDVILHCISLIKVNMTGSLLGSSKWPFHTDREGNFVCTPSVWPSNL